MNWKRIGCLACIIFYNILTTTAQNISNNHVDTLSISIDSAEQIFLRNNYSLLIQKYNINSQKALEIQAKLYPNPNISISRGPILGLNDPLSMYPSSSFTNHPEDQIQINQLIILAGKRNKNVNIAKLNTQITEEQFYDLVRTLKYTLRTTFYNIYFLNNSAKTYTQEIEALQQLVNALDEQKSKGNIYFAEKDVIRIKAQLYSLQAEYANLLTVQNDLQSQLRLLLQQRKTYLVNPQVNEQAVTKIKVLDKSVLSLIDTAKLYRSDLKAAQLNIKLNEANLALQKAMAIPDLTFFIGYDKQGNFARNFHYAGISIDLPFLNRNQGNISSAKTQILAAQTASLQIEDNIQESIFRCVQKLNTQVNLLQSISPTFQQEFSQLANEVLKNYKARNIGLVDFIDFYDAYKENALQQNNIKYNCIQAAEELNFNIGKPLINY